MINQKQNNIMPKTKEEVASQLLKLGIKSNFQINDDLSVDVQGNIDIRDRNLTYIPVQFNIVKGDFNCQKNKLLTLKGSPKEVNGSFDCAHNELISLEGAPHKTTSFTCYRNKLTNLDYCPKNLIVMDCRYNKITSLKGIPPTIEVLYCGNNQIASLEEVTTAIRYLKCDHNLLESVNLDPEIKKLSYLDISNNQIKTLSNLKIEISDRICFLSNKISGIEMQKLCEIKYQEQWDLDNVFIKIENIEQEKNIFITRLRKTNTLMENL